MVVALLLFLFGFAALMAPREFAGDLKLVFVGVSWLLSGVITYIYIQPITAYFKSRQKPKW